MDDQNDRVQSLSYSDRENVIDNGNIEILDEE